ncbi:MAG: hypothetical protein AAEJ04_02375 [Planctomycetota bacterium]
MHTRAQLLFWGFSFLLVFLSPMKTHAGDLDANMKIVEELEELFEVEVKKSDSRSAVKLFEPRFEALAKDFAGTESGLRAELWVLRNHWWKRAAGTMETASTQLALRLIDEYPESAQLTRIAEFRYLYGKDGVLPMMDALIKASPHDRVDAYALHAKAYSLGRSKEETDIAIKRQSLELLSQQYGDVAFRDTTFGAIATAMLSPHPKENLEIGKVAPEIEGMDVDENPIKLSDYRGKIVLIDFWGDW